MLSNIQSQALAHVRARAAQGLDAARANITAILARHAAADRAAELLGSHFRERAVITLNFHPDRLRADGLTVAEGLLQESRYKNQFETGVTNGSPTAVRGGERDLWEERLFGNAYQTGELQPRERPKYGALNLMRHADGGSPRFGSCYVELTPSVSTRCTLTWGDSHQAPEYVGTADTPEPVMSALLETIETTGAALGVAGVDVAYLLRVLARQSTADPRALASSTPGRALDEYIEAQVHGDIDLRTDVARLVADPSFDGTPTGEQLRDLARCNGLQFSWQAGFVLDVDEVPADFRGSEMVPLARRIAAFSPVSGRLDAATLGRALALLHREPQCWADWGTPAETWQHIKQLWHVLVRFGRAP